MNKNKKQNISGSVSGRFNDRNEAILKVLNSNQRFICHNAQHSGKTHLKNLLVQQKAIRKQQPINTFLQMNFTEFEIITIIDLTKNKKLTVKIEHHPGFYSADCPKCGKTKILSNELNSLTAVCNKCYCPFLLEREDETTIQ